GGAWHDSVQNGTRGVTAFARANEVERPRARMSGRRRPRIGAVECGSGLDDCQARQEVLKGKEGIRGVDGEILVGYDRVGKASRARRVGRPSSLTSAFTSVTRADSTPASASARASRYSRRSSYSSGSSANDAPPRMHPRSAISSSASAKLFGSK